jgi:hypothetical protein
MTTTFTEELLATLSEAAVEIDNLDDDRNPVYQRVRQMERRVAEAEKPQREKLIAIADTIDNIDVPSGLGCEDVIDAIDECTAKIRKIANGPLE